MQVLIEVGVAFVVLIVLYYFTFKFLFPAPPNYKPTKYNIIPNKARVDILRGMYPMNSGELAMSTQDPLSPEYVQLPNPSNVKSGAGGFSYSFWLNKQGNTETSLQGKILFMRGLNEVTKVIRGGAETSMILTKAPLLRFPTSGERSPATGELLKGYEMILEFNTLQEPDNKWCIESEVLQIINGNKWVMITFVFHDNHDQYGLKKGVQIDFYMDNKLIATHVVRGDGLKYNEGLLYILPQNGLSSSRVSSSGYFADFKYFNYALSPIEIDSVFAEGYNSGNYTTPKQRQVKTMTNNYQLVTLHNETNMLGA